MNVRLLGLIELSDGGRVLPLPSARARALLASLAWQPRTVVTDAVLLERIWGSALPDNPQDSLYTAAKRLRRGLEVAGHAHRLVRLRGGYLLDVNPAEVDVHRFRSQVVLARDAVRRGFLYEANEAFEPALSGWTGTALADVDSAWAARCRETLGRERLLVQLAAVEVKVRLGRHSEVVPELSELAAEHPLDEGVAALLMLALHRCGLRSAALGVYAEARRHLVGELGVEPGDALRRTHREVLGESGAAGIAAGVVAGGAVGGASGGDVAACADVRDTASTRLRLAG
ncbi:BTAD domain-containing putative transcriptional regulator [Streptomyces sp. NPDC057137]|uniref:AfsR/SARP family transcriptional regulator n=1 Tax=Streptomyces sp. NPDC057137 TaxID=3346030 RepID=UPI003638B09B